MDFFQTLLITVVIFSALVGVYALVAGSGVSKAQKRRMQAVRYRHSESLDAKVDAQFKRAVAARKPKMQVTAGSGSRVEALAIRLDRSGKGWTLGQYGYGSLGIALVFGTEHSGLSNEDVRLCSLPVTIPANPAYSSLNLGAAVQVLCYELRLAMLDAASRPAGDGEQAVAATFDEIEGFHSHLERAMRASGFFDPTNPKRLLPRLRRLFGRIRLERDEVNILRGIIAAFERQAAGAVQGATRSKECSSD